MSKKTLIPGEKWEGLRHAMEEAAGARKTSGTSGIVPVGGQVEDAGRPKSGKKRKAEDEGGKGKKGRKEKEKKKGKKKGKEKKNRKKEKKKNKKKKTK